MVDNIDQGVTLIEKRFHLKRILLVLDDVDKLVQLEMLAGKTDWFGLGSRIIITTRDKHLLRAHDQVESIYLVDGLGHYEALRLFSWNAFKSDKPNGGYVEVTEDALHYCGGLPLALTVVGSTLKGRDIPYWKSKLDEYKKIPHCDIQEILRISFDGLNENAKNIFLDIACFFKGKCVKYVREMLDSCGFHSNTGIDELKDKCLITEDWGSFMMHDLLQEMGREIVRQESSKEPGERSRLWFHEDVRHVLEENTGTNKVEGIMIDLPKPDLIHLSPKAFKKMKGLRLFISRNARLSEEPNFLSNELRIIDWVEYPGEYFPSNFRGKNLVILRMAHSRIKILEGVQHFQNLTTMDFYKCKFLEKIPDVSRIPNLESLKLVDCENLVEVHCSVGFLDQLVELNIAFCSNLKSFPKSFKLRSLKYIKLSGCSMLKNFPKIECQMECLEDIYYCDTDIEELPSSVGYLVGLKKLRLDKSQNLMNLPESICQLQHLEKLSLHDCYSLKELPSSIGYLGRIDELNLSRSGIVTLPQCIESFVLLKSLNLDECKQLREILRLPSNVERVSARKCLSLEIFLEGIRRSQLLNTEDPPELVGVGTEIPAQRSLRVLDLSGSAIVILPTCFNRFVRLTMLDLRDCKQLRKILGLPPNVKTLHTWNCLSLEVFLGEARRSPLRVGTVSSAVQPLEQKFQLKCPFENLKCLDLSDSAIVSLPTLLNRFVELSILNLERCKKLREVPELPRNIEQVHLVGCTSLERLPFNNIYDLPVLWWIDFSDCPKHMGNVVHNHLFSEGHPKVGYFQCVYPGNRIPGCFSYCKEVSNTNWCEIDTGPLHLDSENITFSFFAVIGMRDDESDKSMFQIELKVFNNGQRIYSALSLPVYQSARSDHVWLNYRDPYHSQLMTNNLRVKFEIEDPPPSVFFKSCGFHIEQRYEEKSTGLMDGLQLSKRRRDDDDGGSLESNWCPQQKRHSSLQRILELLCSKRR